jgi:hypothetical protein
MPEKKLGLEIPLLVCRSTYNSDDSQNLNVAPRSLLVTLGFMVAVLKMSVKLFQSVLSLHTIIYRQKDGMTGKNYK